MNVEVKLSKKNERYVQHILYIIDRYEIPHISRIIIIESPKYNEDKGDVIIVIFTKNHLNSSFSEDKKYYEYFSDRRYFAFPTWMEKVVTKPILFSLNNGWAKYYQVDKKDQLKFKKNEF